MKPVARYLTHPQVAIDSRVPIQDWGLSDIGRSRTEALARARPWPKTTRIVTSTEQKAVETAVLLAAAWGCPMEVRPDMHENNRDATGFLPPLEFERAADRFFRAPNESYCGWETASDAQVRIVGEVMDYLWYHLDGDLLFVGHGAVGTLLYCALGALPIDRRFDQPHGGGNWFSFDITSRGLQQHWCSLEKALAADVLT